MLTVFIFRWTDKKPLENAILEHPNITMDSTMITGERLREKIFNKASVDKDVSNFKKVKKYLRHLDDDCNDLMIKIEENNYELDKAFDLGFDMVHKMSFGILIINCLNFGIIIIILIFSLGALCCGKKVFLILAPLFIVMIIVALLSSITNLVLFIIMMVNYYKGDTTGEFLGFYEKCLDKDIKPSLEDTYNRLDKLNKIFTAFVVLNFIGIFLNSLSSCCKKKKKR